MPDRLLLDDLLLSRAAVDRAAHRRTDENWQEQRLADSTTRVLWVANGAAAVAEVEGTARLIFSSPVDIDSSVEVSFLGVDAEDRAYFSAHVENQSDAPVQAAWKSLREVGRSLSDIDAGLLVTAVALDNWRSATGRCAKCGGEVVSQNGGWSLRCITDEVDHFPRTEPAVIVLVRDQDDRALLGRHVNWPPGLVSTFAGFVEAGESAEAAVRRELTEETGVVIADHLDAVQYLGSQPWPFPASLMLGYHAWAKETAIKVDETEIAEANWYSRDELSAACASGAIKLPSSISISRRLIERWYGEELPADWSW
ncbi:unannotated protein [freshwater metagenome]|uniref:NAD(+) diphosphatase n=1 Tax=freshwater metagenome TaxID=449393 RepID=A0A6J6M3V2_9ZZZZ|nr:NAD(+) diphosphatase [Actinomycetota bacterium]